MRLSHVTSSFIHHVGITDTENSNDFRVELNGISSIPNSIQICLVYLKLNYTDRQTLSFSARRAKENIIFKDSARTRKLTLTSAKFSWLVL
jgi:hypothetical protein